MRKPQSKENRIANGKRVKEWWSHPENRKRQSESHIGNVGYWKGKKIPQYARRKMRLAKLGKYDGPKHPQWKGGISFEPYPVDWTLTLKRSIRERDNYVCRLCNQYATLVHHIDYNKNNCCPENLITLCRKCHAKTNHNRNNWLKYFKKI